MNFVSGRLFLSIVFCAGMIMPTLLAIKNALADSNPPTSLSKQTVQLTVPYEKQETARQCGLAAVNMVSGYYDHKLAKTQQDWLKSSSQAGNGILGSELVVVLRAAGFDTAVFQGTLDKAKTGLYYHLEKHRPLIVMISSEDGKSSHYDVLTGYDPQKSVLFLLDPALGPITVTTKDFIPAWKRAHYFTLAAVPKKLMNQTLLPTQSP